MRLLSPGTIVLVVVAIVVARMFIRAARAQNTPEARAEAEHAAGARADALSALPPGWSLSDPDAERYGAGPASVRAYGLVAVGPSGERWFAAALDETAAYRAAVDAAGGRLEEREAWAPPIPDGDVTSPAAGRPDARLPEGWVLETVDYESFSAGQGSVATYGALANGPNGQRALVMARNKDDAVARLVDVIDGRLPPADHWAFRF